MIFGYFCKLWKRKIKISNRSSGLQLLLDLCAYALSYRWSNLSGELLSRLGTHLICFDAEDLVKIIALVGLRCRKHSKAAKGFTKVQLAKVGADIKLLVTQV